MGCMVIQGLGIFRLWGGLQVQESMEAAAAAAMHTIQLDGPSKQLLEVASLRQALHQPDRQQPHGQQLDGQAERQGSGAEPSGQVDEQQADEGELEGQLHRQSPVQAKLQASTSTSSAHGADACEVPPAAHGVPEDALHSLFCCPLTKVRGKYLGQPGILPGFCH